MSGARVFVVQDAKYLNKKTGQVEDKYDLSPVEKFGRLVPVMGTGKILPERAPQAMRQIAEVLKNYTPEDFILIIGDPAAIVGVCMVAARNTGGKLKLLRWDRWSSSYEVVALELIP